MKDNTLQKVRQFIEKNALLQKGDRVIVALSGGADSTALLHILISLEEKYLVDDFISYIMQLFSHKINITLWL